MLIRSIDQLPADYRAGHDFGDDPATVIHPILVRADSAGATKAFLAELQGRNIGFSVGFPTEGPTRKPIEQTPDAARRPTINSDHTARFSTGSN